VLGRRVWPPTVAFKVPATDPTTADPANTGATAINPRRVRYSEKRAMQFLLNIIGSPFLWAGLLVGSLTHRVFFQSFRFRL